MIKEFGGETNNTADSGSKSEPIGAIWDKLATDATIIQDAKNKVLNRTLLAQVKKYTPSGEVFDYGCGWGEWADELHKNGYSVTAFDVSDAMVNEARKKFGASASFLSKIEYESSAPTLAGRFELITSNLVLCIMNEDEQRRMLRSMKQMLKPGGTILISFCHPHHDYKPENVTAIKQAPPGARYEDTFVYRKKIKENGIEFDDNHRPMEFYLKLFDEFGLAVVEQHESDTLNTGFDPDFIIFTLKLKEA